MFHNFDNDDPDENNIVSYQKQQLCNLDYTFFNKPPHLHTLFL